MYLVHGLNVRSAVRLDAPTTRASRVDVKIRLGERRAIPDATPEGRLLARLSLPAGGYSLTAGANGYVFRVHGLCDFALGRSGCDVNVHLTPDADQELASLLIGGVLAAMLALEGHSVLHASAIEADGGAVAFIGGSGTGKTTLAALCCAAGARLVTDDVLRIELRGDAGWCFRGSRELRLRPGAAQLATQLTAWAEHSTTDQRTAVRAVATEQGTLPLAAVVAPRCVHDATALHIERLRGSAAMLELLRFPRTVGWVDAEHSRQDFGRLAKLAETVPVYRAEVPWGPPFDPRIARTLLDPVALDVVAGSRAA